MAKRYLITLFVLCVSVCGLGQNSSEQADSLAMHYWDDFNFNDDVFVNSASAVELEFRDFINILSGVSKKREAVRKLYDNAAKNPDVLDYFVQLSEKYLNDFESRFYDEELYIIVLEKLLSIKEVLPESKDRLEYQYACAMKNRVGEKAADFGFLLKDGGTNNLHGVKADYILMYFYDPACDDCNIVKRKMAESSEINRMLDDGKLKLLSICVENSHDEWLQQRLPVQWIDACDKSMSIIDEELYYLPNLPILYVLDSEHKVIMKNTTPEKIEQYFEKLQ